MAFNFILKALYIITTYHLRLVPPRSGRKYLLFSIAMITVGLIIGSVGADDAYVYKYMYYPTLIVGIAVGVFIVLSIFSILLREYLRTLPLAVKDSYKIVQDYDVLQPMKRPLNQVVKKETV